MTKVSMEDGFRLCREMLEAACAGANAVCYSGTETPEDCMNMVYCDAPDGVSGFDSMVNRLFETRDLDKNTRSNDVYTAFLTACEDIVNKHGMTMDDFKAKWYFGHEGLDYYHAEVKRDYVDFEDEMLKELDRLIEFYMEA